MNELYALSPLDGRYASKTEGLRDYFSEYAFIKYRYVVEVEWAIFLSDLGLRELIDLKETQKNALRDTKTTFGLEQAQAIKALERKTNHDVKAIEYFVKDTMRDLGLSEYVEAVHFCCTSEDINNTAYALMIADALRDVMFPEQKRFIDTLRHQADACQDAAMMSKTHGQPATPTTMGKELAVFCRRLERILEEIQSAPILAKFNGAVGNYNAHYCVYPEIDWPEATRTFLERLGLRQNPLTTQVESRDWLAALLQAYTRWNTVLLDFTRDMWGYISEGAFTQSARNAHAGSSTMPHKVNPIDFENAEGNLGLANALSGHLSAKLPISRRQRDLSDSTVLRHIGACFGHVLLALTSADTGLSKIRVNRQKLEGELAESWELLGEAIQSVMRRHRIPESYEQLKTLTRGNAVTQENIRTFIAELPLPKRVKEALSKLTPQSYLGISDDLSKY